MFSLNLNKFVYIFLAVLAVTLVFCAREATPVAQSREYLNLSDTVDYVGMQTCRSCHANIYDTYVHSGMGKSFDAATPKKSDATFGKHVLVHDDELDLYYKPFFKDSVLFITEFRIGEQGDTIHKRTEKVDYIIGSGHHTNSHIININGYIYQAPITFYTQDEKWDLAPGFEGGANSRFSRLLTTECITCHNHYPDHVEGSVNKYVSMPGGIECERCHGPGEVHVREKLKGNIVDTSKYIDYTIVNPKNLPRDLQMDLCQRCHLQGIAVLEEGKTFFDFKPGMKLSSVMNVFLPRYTNSHEKFIMASQADRMRMSDCYKLSEELSCITCHNPHHSLETVNKDQYNNACNNCHGKGKTTEKLCSAPANEIELASNNCISCHMRPSGSIDIPHVTITDHYLSKETAVIPSKTEEISREEKEEIARFLGLEILTKEAPEPLDMAKGYIELYDKFVGASMMLDSAAYFLSLSKKNSYEFFKTKVHYLFSAGKFDEIIAFKDAFPFEEVRDGWTAYRVGEALYQNNQFKKAVDYLKKATILQPYNLDFQEKLGAAYVRGSMVKEAIKTFNFVLSENPKRPISLCNLGFARAINGDLIAAEALYDQAIALNPDYEQAFLNKAAVKINFQDYESAKKLLKKVLEINPSNEQALGVLLTIKESEEIR